LVEALSSEVPRPCRRTGEGRPADSPHRGRAGHQRRRPAQLCSSGPLRAPSCLAPGGTSVSLSARWRSCVRRQTSWRSTGRNREPTPVIGRLAVPPDATPATPTDPSSYCW